jgi:hypothetical protein
MGLVYALQDVMIRMKREVCLFYVGVGYDHSDISGNGGCLGLNTVGLELVACNQAIKENRCPRSRTTHVGV